MRTLLFAFVLSFAGQSHVTIIKQSVPERALVLESRIPAPVAAVWEAFSTSDGLSTWLTPGAVVELKKGGEWTARYPGGKTGGGTIISFIPRKEMIIAAMAPEQFPTVRAERTTAKFEFIDRDESTVVRLTQTGWKSGDEWDRAYNYLATGNAQLLETLRQRFITGPVDWQKAWGISK
jgi:uncharacterized protein YndB with AHSA1/START domain